MSMRLALGLAAAFVLAACASTGTPLGASANEAAGGPPQAVQPNVNLSGYNAAFKAGYADGCDSARGRARRNAQRYGADTDYMMGWNDGHSVCGRTR